MDIIMNISASFIELMWGLFISSSYYDDTVL